MTGAGRIDGVGYATALVFARSGASGIALADIHGVSDDLLTGIKDAARIANRPEPTVLGQATDISDAESVKQLLDAIESGFDGRLDILVNNAGYMEPFGTILELDPAIYWRTWEVNVRGLFNMTRAFLPLLLQTRRQHSKGLCTIINVSSSGAQAARPQSASYRSSKLAILRWTENVQLDHAEDGLLTYCVNPGAIKTTITQHTPEEIRDRLPHSPDIAGDTIAWLARARRQWLAGRYTSCPWDMQELAQRQTEVVAGDKLKVRMVF